MTICGINLRQEDAEQFYNTCQSAGINPHDIPVLFCWHDDTLDMIASCQNTIATFDINVVLNRCMVFNSQLLPPRLPSGVHIIGWNEADDTSAYPNLPSWVDPWWQGVRNLSNNLKIHYGAPNVDGYLLENQPLEATLDFVDRHIGSTFAPPPATIQGKPTYVTEIDIDPNRFDYTDPASMQAAYTELLGCMENCLKAGIPAFGWGILQDRPDVAYSSYVLQNIISLNNKYALTPEQQAEQAYNTLTGGTPFIPGQQYVQNNNDGTFTTVVQFSTLQAAQDGYNTVTGGIPFVAGQHYVQDDGDGTYKVVVKFPL